MIILLQRYRCDGERTFGELLVEGRRLCATLEDPVREVPGQPVDTWKVHGATAIPVGVYRLSLEQSPRFGPDTLTIHGVPGFTGVRMHAGNTETDTEGCPLLGLSIDAHGIAPGTSRPAVDLVRAVVRQALATDASVQLDVRNPLPIASGGAAFGGSPTVAPTSPTKDATMILLDTVLHNIIRPALALLPAKMDTPAAHAQQLAIGLQESRLLQRAQKTRDPYVKGPARGLWQCEPIAVVHVLTHLATLALARQVCLARGVPADAMQVHARLEFDDVLAAAVARLLLWTEPQPLPPLDADHETAWQYYLRCWRPGHPRRETWDAFHTQAVSQVIH